MDAERKFLTEDEVVELMALFFSCALLLLREPARYGPLRQLTAAERLAAMVIDDVSPEVRKLLEVALGAHSGLAYDHRHAGAVQGDRGGVERGAGRVPGRARRTDDGR